MLGSLNAELSIDKYAKLFGLMGVLNADMLPCVFRGHDSAFVC
jgi:hypothetical protein